MVWTPRGELPQMKLDGNDIELLNLCLEGRPQITSPESKTVEYDLDGGFNGNVFVDTGWNNLSIKVRFNYLEVSSTVTFREQFAMYRSRFYSAKTLEFNDQPDVIYTVKTVRIGDALNDFVDYGSFEIEFICEPFGIKTSAPIVITATTNTLQNNTGWYTAYPLITVTGIPTTAGTTMRIRMLEVLTNNYFFDCNITGSGIPASATKLVIDGRKRLVWYETSGGVKSYPKGEMTMVTFPAIPRGNFRVITTLPSPVPTGMTITIDKNEVV